MIISLQTAEVLKRYAQKVQSASTRERVAVLQEVVKCVDETGTPPTHFTAVKNICFIEVSPLSTTRSCIAVT